MKDDTISRQTAIDLWERYHPYIASKAMEYDEALRALPSAQPDLSSYSDKLWRVAYERGKAEAQRWIPCSEGLPDPNTWVLVSCDNDVTIMAVTGYGKWYLTDGDFTHEKIDVWMELPKPYEGGEQ